MNLTTKYKATLYSFYFIVCLIYYTISQYFAYLFKH